jgi:hypothetical protein
MGRGKNGATNAHQASPVEKQIIIIPGEKRSGNWDSDCGFCPQFPPLLVKALNYKFAYLYGASDFF